MNTTNMETTLTIKTETEDEARKILSILEEAAEDELDFPFNCQLDVPGTLWGGRVDENTDHNGWEERPDDH